MKPPYAIGSVPSLSGHAIAYRWRSLPRVRRHRASKPQGSSERVLPWQITMDQLIFASLSHTHYWYEVAYYSQNKDIKQNKCVRALSDLDRTISQQKQSCTDARVRLVCVGGLIVRAHSALPCMYINWAVARFKGLRCCYKQTNTVSCTVATSGLYGTVSMAELYRCPSAIDDVRESVIVRAGSALPSICMGCTIYCLLCANIYG